MTSEDREAVLDECAEILDRLDSLNFFCAPETLDLHLGLIKEHVTAIQAILGVEVADG